MGSGDPVHRRSFAPAPRTRPRSGLSTSMGEITVRTWIDAPVELCFDLARDVGMHVESAAFSGERLVAPGKLSGILEVGDLVCFEGRHAGLPQRFCARITFAD